MDSLSLIKLKLKGVKDSAQRARLAFFIVILSTCAITVTLYNEHFAWSRRLLEEARGFTESPDSDVPAAATPAIPRADSAAELKIEKRLQTVRNWEDDTYIKLDLLGIRLGAADLTFFGSIAMLVVSIYYCLCARRTRYDIGSVIHEVNRTKDAELRNYVLAGIRQSLVLTVAAENNDVISETDNATSPPLMRLIGSVLSFLTYSPTIAIAAILLGDIKFAFFGGKVPNSLWVLQHLLGEYLVQFILLDLLALTLMVFVWHVNRLTVRFQSAAGAAVRSLADVKAATADQSSAAAASR